MSAKDWIPAYEAARLSGLHINTIHGLAVRGILTVRLEKRGPLQSRRMFHRDEVLAYRCPRRHHEAARLERLAASRGEA